MILSRVPYEGTLNILDVSTVPGLFARILFTRGHDVTGIRCMVLCKYQCSDWDEKNLPTIAYTSLLVVYRGNKTK